jgi:hypothetical protein
MPERLKISLTAVAVLALAFAAVPATAGVPDVTNSFYVPQTGTVATPTEGTVAIRLFRMCPNMDGSATLPNNSRIKVVVRDVNGNGIPGVAAADICVLFNGGSAAQGFSGVGADSVVANSTFNASPLCPDVRCVAADVPTDASGTTYITFLGSDGVTGGVAVRNANRKWGHYDTELPVYVLGFKLSGRLTSASANGTYTLRIKNVDWTGGLATTMNAGEAVSITDFNGISNGIGINNVISYWKDFDGSGSVNSPDLNIVTTHLNHNCTFPLNP